MDHCPHCNHNKPSPPLLSGAVYICPMDPEIRQDHPGACPICGMALEPELPSLTNEENEELSQFRKLFFISLPFTLALMILAMGGHVFHWISGSISNWIQLALCLPVVLWAGAPIYKRFFQSIRRASPNMWTLIGMGSGVSFLYSLVATFAPDIFPPGFLPDTTGSAHPVLPVYYEATAVIITLALLGQIWELKARAHTSDSLKSLLELTPETTTLVLENGKEEPIAVEKVKPGDKLRIHPGDAIPVDGIVQEGTGEINESMITGEALPSFKEKGSRLIGGTVNSTSTFLMEATQTGTETTLARIIGLVVKARRSRAPIQNMADRVSKYFVLGVILIAIITFIIWTLMGHWNLALVNAVSVLIIACPCALGLATPMSIMVASGRAASLGVLFRDAQAMETLSKVTVLAMDKTGTLTEGKPQFISLTPEPGYEEGRLLYLAASLELGSEHSIAQAITGEAKRRDYTLNSPQNFQYFPGGGVTGTVEQDELILGSSRFLKKHEINTKALDEKEETLRESGEGIVFLCVNGTLAGTFTLRDKVKPEAKESVEGLQKMGLAIAVISGDVDKTVRMTALSLGVDSSHGGLTPQGKVDFINELRSRGSIIAMAGDGINDAPSLTAANVGIAMSNGSDAALENSDISLLQGDLRGIVRAFKLSKATVSNMRANLFLALVYNGIGIPVAAGVLYPLGILLSPPIAALAMCLSSVSVILNSLRLKHIKI